MEWLWFIPGAIFTIVFTIWMGLFTYLDITNPEWWKAKAIGERDSLNAQVLKRVVPVVIANMVFSFLLLTVLWNARLYYFGSIAVESLSATQFVLQLLGCYLVSDFAFTVNHWIGHRYHLDFHKLHHEFPKPFAICSFYCGFWEMILLNLPVAELGPLLFGVHPYVHIVWLMMSGTYVSFDHCGHQIGPTWIFDVTYHDFHHAHPGVHHGSHIWDRIWGLKQTQ